MRHERSELMAVDALETSDSNLLDLLRKSGALSVAQIGIQTGVTATAVRQRLTRLLACGDVERATERSGRGRPLHLYRLTDQGRRKTGSNFSDLAMALWHEVREIKDVEVRRGLLSRLAKRLAESYSREIHGVTLVERMESLAKLFASKQIPFEVDRSGGLPVLRAIACPYPDLAEQDRTVCSMERMLFADLLGEGIKLTDCRLEGGNCCKFESSEAAVAVS